MRAFFYFFFSAMAKRRELESQGVVTVFVCNDRPSFDGGSRKEIGKPQQPSPDLPLKLSQLRRTYPFRNDCVHGCMQDRESLSIFGFLLRRLNHFERARSLCHIGK